MKLKEEYVLANCCRPGENDLIVGYYSYNNVLKVHKAGCDEVAKADPDRLVRLEWQDIRAVVDPGPGDDFRALDDLDFRILAHHRDMGIDYSLKVAGVLHLNQQVVFERHAKLRMMGLVKRVEPRLVQYRKHIVKGKWIKHRNHTYYDLTDKGAAYLCHHLRMGAHHKQ